MKLAKKIIVFLSLSFFLFLVLAKIFSPKKIKPFQIYIPEPKFLYQSLPYQDLAPFSFKKTFPLEKLPQESKEIFEKLKKEFGEKDEKALKENGALLISSNFSDFKEAFSFLKENEIPIFISSDYLLAFFNLEISEIKKNIELKKIRPILLKVLEELLKESQDQYLNYQAKGYLAQLAKGNIAYLSVALSLLDPNFQIPEEVEKEVKKELEYVKKGEGSFLSPIFGRNCPKICQNLILKNDKCHFPKAEERVYYYKKEYRAGDFFKKYCLGKCLCLNYSHFNPKGYYQLTDEFKNYFRAKKYLQEVIFDLKNEDLFRRAILLTLALDKGKVFYEGEEREIKDLWARIYATLAFFEGDSSQLNFSNFSKAFNEILKERKISSLSQIAPHKIRSNEILRVLIKEGYQFKEPEVDLFGFLKWEKFGLTFFPLSKDLKKEIALSLTYPNIGPNPKSIYFKEVRGYARLWEEFNCQDLKNDKFKKNWSEKDYWAHLCRADLEIYSLRYPELLSSCKFGFSMIEFLASLGFEKSVYLEKKLYPTGFCGKEEKRKEIEKMFSEVEKNNFPNLKIFLIRSIFDPRIEKFLFGKENQIWQMKNLISSLVFSITPSKGLYLEEVWKRKNFNFYNSSPWERKKKEEKDWLELSGYLEPNPYLYFKMAYLLQVLKRGLIDQQLITGKVYLSLDKSIKIFQNLKEISIKELSLKNLSLKDKDFIKTLDKEFFQILKDLASPFLFKKGLPFPGGEKKIYLKGEPFKLFEIETIFRSSYLDKAFQIGEGKIDWIILAKGDKILVGPIPSYYEFFISKESEFSRKIWKEKVAHFKRPIFYKELNISSSNSPYIVK